MKNLTIAIVLTIVAFLVINGIAYILSETPDDQRADQPRLEADQVVASFEREFNHQPAPAARASRSAIDDDILYKTVNNVHWSSDDRGNPEEKTVEHIDERNSLDEPGLETGRQLDE